MELRPGNKRVVHLANLIVDRSRMLRQRDGEDSQPGFTGMEFTTGSRAFDPDSHFLFWKRDQRRRIACRYGVGSWYPARTSSSICTCSRPVPEMVNAVWTLLCKQPRSDFHAPATGARWRVDTTGRRRFAVRIIEPASFNQSRGDLSSARYLGKQVEAGPNCGGDRRPLLLINDWDLNWQKFA
jgi:hypothetical protein